MNEPENKSELTMDGVLTIVRGWNLPFQILLRRRFGHRYFSGLEMLGVFAPLVFAGIACRSAEASFPFVLHFLALMVAVPWQRWSAWLNRFERTAPSSYYNGWPRVCDGSRSTERRAKLFGEPLLLLSAGLALIFWFEHYGLYLLMGSVTMYVEAFTAALMRENWFFDMRDSVLQQEEMADDFDRI